MENRQKDKQAKPGNNFLTPNEQAICMQISKGKPPYNQQALTLLALQARNTQLQASEKSGLTPGQVKYLAAKFRKQRLSIFPGELLNKLNDSIEEQQFNPVSDKTKLAKAEKKKSDSGKGKSKKEKANKMKKKDKMAKKDEKSKKEKKSKKKDEATKKASKDKKVKKDKKSKKKTK